MVWIYPLHFDMKQSYPKFKSIQFKSSNGFTLVEVLVVVAVLGIVAAIAIPMYNNYVRSTKTESARASLEQFGVLLESFRAERGQFPANGTYRYTEDNIGAVVTDNFRLPVAPAPTAIFPDFRPRGLSAGTTSFHYRMTVSNSGNATTEQAVINIIGVTNSQANFDGINATATFR
jgi:prepilin-type N-terminal cleavage/methylation domain-containing protein